MEEEKDRFLIAVEVDEQMYNIIEDIKQNIKKGKLKIQGWHYFFECSILSFLRILENDIPPVVFDKFIESHKKDNCLEEMDA